ncbi:MAG: hypothetical protein LBB39_00500 [Mycoplasmataceae bacterium]|jgi:XTP/dITP diphosphohydrolase|nr:hypothetical protein [Mycoplasmataceae bacterium]
MKQKILIATTNQGKFNQFLNALQSKLGDKYDFISLNDINYKKDIVEDKETLLENSIKKAQETCSDTGYICLSDDSGFFINALPNLLGIFCGRYRKSFSTREKCHDDILAKLKDKKDRSCYYETSIAVAFPNGKLLTSVGKCEGFVDTKYDEKYIGVNISPNGAHAFDFIFIDKKTKKPLPELTSKQLMNTNARGKALKKIIKLLS